MWLLKWLIEYSVDARSEHGFYSGLAEPRNGKHVVVACIMKPKAGYDYLATAAHFAAESSTGTNVNVCTTDDFTKSVDALVYYIDPDREEMKITYPNLLFERNIIDGRGMMCSFLTLCIGNNQGRGLSRSAIYSCCKVGRGGTRRRETGTCGSITQVWATSTSTWA